MSSDDGGSLQPRAADRLTFQAVVGIRRAGLQSRRVRVFDGSPEGCKIEFVERPILGERVWVKFDGLESVEGTVRWLEGDVGGVQFARPLHEAVFYRLAASNSAERL